MTRLLLIFFLLTIIKPANAAEKKYSITFPAEVVAVQNYAYVWLYLDNEHIIQVKKYVAESFPQKLNARFMLVSLAGVSNNGPDEEIEVSKRNYKYTIRKSMVESLEKKKFNFECADIKNNIPSCVLLINNHAQSSYNQYLLMRGISKLNDDNIPESSRDKLLEAEEYARENGIGVWESFYGVLDQF